MRIRSLKPGFFKNEQLAELSPWHRLCFEGLWCYADREGRMLDRPKRLKAEIFPYDDLDMNLLLWDLSRVGLITRYAINGTPLIWIPTFLLHQHPRQDEAASTLPAFVPGSERPGGPDVSTFPAVRPIETDPSLSSDEPATAARMGSGNWDLGTGKMGETAAVAPAFRAQDLVDLWNATTKPPIPKCRELTPDRQRKIRSRIARRPKLAEWREAFEAIQANAFCRGENDRQWTADFDWVIKNDTVIAKVLERARTSRQSQPEGTELTCPHDPPCSAPGRWACQQKSATDAYKASQRTA